MTVDIDRVVSEANMLVSTFYAYGGDDKDEQMERCVTDLRRALVLHETDAKPFPAGGLEPLDGADDLVAHLKESVANSDRDQLREDIDTLALELARAKSALREVSARVDRSSRMPYRDQASVLSDIRAYVDRVIAELEWECDRCGARQPTTYVPEYGANFCERCAADPLRGFKRLGNA